MDPTSSPDPKCGYTHGGGYVCYCLDPNPLLSRTGYGEDAKDLIRGCVFAKDVDRGRAYLDRLPDPPKPDLQRGSRYANNEPEPECSCGDYGPGVDCPIHPLDPDLFSMCSCSDDPGVECPLHPLDPLLHHDPDTKLEPDPGDPDARPEYDSEERKALAEGYREGRADEAASQRTVRAHYDARNQEEERAALDRSIDEATRRTLKDAPPGTVQFREAATSPPPMSQEEVDFNTTFDQALEKFNDDLVEDERAALDQEFNEREAAREAKTPAEEEARNAVHGSGPPLDPPIQSYSFKAVDAPVGTVITYHWKVENGNMVEAKPPTYNPPLDDPYTNPAVQVLRTIIPPGYDDDLDSIALFQCLNVLKDLDKTVRGRIVRSLLALFAEPL